MPRSLAACRPPVFIASKYGIPWSFGTKATLIFLSPPALDPSEPLFLLHPPTASDAETMVATQVMTVLDNRMRGSFSHCRLVADSNPPTALTPPPRPR